MDEFGDVTTLHPPVKGTFQQPFSCGSMGLGPMSAHYPRTGTRGVVGSNRLPKLNFPSFDGTQPRLWISRCEDYFELYEVDRSMWVRVSAMHFTSAASRWLPSVSNLLRSCSWEAFCHLILDRFGRDQHELLIRQLLAIKQSGSVEEYIDQFSALVDQLAAYQPTPDPLYFALRFMDGLKDEIRSPVMLQRPSNGILLLSFLVCRRRF